MNQYWPDETSCDPEEDCSNVNYSGNAKPTCNKGLGCVVCWAAYRDTQEAEELMKEKFNVGL